MCVVNHTYEMAYFPDLKKVSTILPVLHRRMHTLCKSQPAPLHRMVPLVIALCKGTHHSIVLKHITKSMNMQSMNLSGLNIMSMISWPNIDPVARYELAAIWITMMATPSLYMTCIINQWQPLIAFHCMNQTRKVYKNHGMVICQSRDWVCQKSWIAWWKPTTGKEWI